MLSDFTVVFTENQTNGRGQMGSDWVSGAGTSLTFSVFLDSSFLTLKNQFYLNCAVALSVYTVVERIIEQRVAIKWPNDILCQQKKIAGILIENIVKNTSTTHAVIGVGLNVNQTDFNNLPKATSLLKLVGRSYDLESLLVLIVKELQFQVQRLRAAKYLEIAAAYDAVLFRKNKPSTFKNAKGDLFMGYIKSVNSSGHLEVLLEDEVLKEFRLKEIQLLY